MDSLVDAMKRPQQYRQVNDRANKRVMSKTLNSGAAVKQRPEIFLQIHHILFRGLSVDPDSGVTLETAQLSDGEKKTDEFFGDIEVYHQEARAVIPMQRSAAGERPAALTVKYQGCAEIGVCYPPITKIVDTPRSRYNCRVLSRNGVIGSFSLATSSCIR